MKIKPNKLLRSSAAPITALLLAAAIIGGTAMAQFTLSHRARRVIAAYDARELLFSSNYLQEQRVQRSYYSDSESGSVTVDFTICNYAQGNHFIYHEQAFTYDLSAKVVEVDQGSASPLSDYSAAGVPTITSGSGSTHALSDNGSYAEYIFEDVEMAPDPEHGITDITHIYHLTFPEEFIDNPTYYVELIATPSSSDLQPISVWLNYRKSAGVAVKEWELVLRDNTSNPVSDYSGFNYQLRGSGEGTVTLTWNSALLELSDVFWESIGCPTKTVSAGLTSISFHVDSVYGKNSYDIQFYRAGGTVSAWSALAVGTAVSCSFTPDAGA